MKGLVMRPNSKIEQGFERPPIGALFEQIIEINGPMGIAYERSCEFYKDFHHHERLMFICPRGTCEMEVQEEISSRKYQIDNKVVVSVPPSISHDDRGTSSIYDTFALYPQKSLVEDIAQRLRLGPSEILSLYSECKTIGRSPLLEQLLQSYFYQRIIQREDPELLKVFEEIILIEILSLIFKRGHNRAVVDSTGVEMDSVACKCMNYIESNLFSNLSLSQLTQQIGCSASVLSKSFKAEFGQSPYAFIKSRRLEEAKRLLQRGGHSVSEVAMMVGYGNFGAFSDAFRQKFKKAPKHFLLKPGSKTL